MPNFQAVSKTTHADKRWKLFSNYAFTSQDAVAPLVVDELPPALMHMPIAFIKQQDQYALVAVLGLQAGQNLFVATDGRWLGGYAPAVYRGSPFQLARTDDDQQALVVDADSGLVNDTEGEAFFDEEDKPTQRVRDIFDFLLKVQTSRALTQRICAVLAEHQLIQPWPINVKDEAGERQVEGLYRIDEAAMNTLAPEAFEALRQSGALPVAYCQLLSMQHLQTLGKLAEAHASAKAQSQAALPTTDTGELDLEFLNNNGTISFGPH